DVVATAAAGYVGDADQREARLAAHRRGGKELDPADIYLVAVRFDGLKPGHLYCYQLVAGELALTEPAPLTTAAPPGDDTLRFVALGDTGTGGAAQRAIAARVSAVAFELMVFLGDLAYEDGTPRQLQSNFFAVYQDFMRYVPV